MKIKNFSKQKNTFGVHLAWAALLLCFAALSCSEAPIGQIPTDKTPPSQLTNVEITPTYGGAYVTYSLPKGEEDISYVKCEFDYNGKHRVVRSSIYKNYLEVDGLGTPEEIELNISVVDHSENASIPYVRKFMPLDPPMTAVLNSFTVEPAFGGVKITWENPAKMMAGISFLAANDYGELELKDMVFSSLPEGTKSLRGFNTDRRTFALCIMDKYENISDTLKFEMTPLYEVMLDKAKFADAHLNGDNFSMRGTDRHIDKIWDGTLNVIWHTDASAGYTIPQYFSVDLGVIAQLTRVLIYNHADYLYGQHNLRRFDIWGTNELKQPIESDYYEDGSWKADWMLLRECEIIKPSGSPVGTNTVEDIAANTAGFEFEFPQDVPRMRYIRFIVHETWARTAAIHLAEISVFGDER
jgi:hypothetical protein